jgi:hypothetical protein
LQILPPLKWRILYLNVEHIFAMGAGSAIHIEKAVGLIRTLVDNSSNAMAKVRYVRYRLVVLRKPIENNIC